MKNWFKTLKTHDFNIHAFLIDEDDSETPFGIQITIQFEGVLMNKKMCFEEEDTRDHVWRNTVDEGYIRNEGTKMFLFFKSKS